MEEAVGEASKKDSPSRAYDLFKKNILNAFHLYGRVFTQKFSKDDNRLMRAMYITYLISCLESYFTGLFKEMFSKNLLNKERIFRIKRIKKLKFNFNDLQEIQSKKISVAEILAENMNFQNMKYIYEFAKAIEFNKYSQKVKQSLNKTGENQDINKSLGVISKQKNRGLDNLNVSKAINKLILEYMADDNILLKLYSADKCFNTIAQMVCLRHEVVHKAKNINIKHAEIWAYTMATFQFANMFHRIYEIKVKELKDKLEE
ncbi:MAG: hypothetical protein WC438_03970 [Candidatus Pacearchaeota archaeon]